MIILLEYDPAITIGDSTGFNVEASKENDNGCGEACREGKEEEEKKEVEHNHVFVSTATLIF